VPFSLINGISVDSKGNYVVDYETFEYTEKLPGQHVHFFFNTTPPDQAGHPGTGNWYVWGGPRPFNRFRLIDRPKEAVQMCVLVANTDHSVIFESGNCMVLPDIVAAAPVRDTPCMEEPDTASPVMVILPDGKPVLVLGISPDEQWWNVQNPTNPKQSCWLERKETIVSGDLSTLPLVYPSPLPTGAVAANLFVEIQGITIDQGRYVVQYVTKGFTEQIPGTHMHFFFDTVPFDQVGADGSGSRLMHGGPTPFAGYQVSDRPQGATKMCVLVANPDHSVIPDSGNCFDLPTG
jgi:hypothetical protein